MYWYIEVLKKYATFTGRSRRKEFWMFFLVNAIIATVSSFIEMSLFNSEIVYLVYSLVVFLPLIAVSIRRLHDIDRTGWWLMIAFIPLIGIIILIVFNVTKGTIGENKYGSDPKRREINA